MLVDPCCPRIHRHRLQLREILAGGWYAGWNPPIESAKFGCSPHFTRIAICPEIGYPWMIESCRAASSENVLFGKSSVPAIDRLILTSGVVRLRQQALDLAEEHNTGPGSSRMIPISAGDQRRRPPPELRQRPEHVVPLRAPGTPSPRSRMIVGAFSIRVLREQQVLRPPRDARASASASLSTVRLIPTSPPTPFSVNPNPSWIGVNSAEITMTNEKPTAWHLRLDQPERLDRDAVRSSSIAPL